MTPKGFVWTGLGALVILLTILLVALGMPWWGALPAALFSVYVNAVLLRWEDGEYPPVRPQRIALAVLGFVVLMIVAWQLLT